MISTRLRCLHRRLSYLIGVVFERCLALLSTGNAGSYRFVLQRFTEPVGVVAAIPEQPIDLWQAAEQRSRSDVVAGLSCGDKQGERSTLVVTDGMQLRVHAALGLADEASTPPFLRPSWSRCGAL